MPRPVFGSDLPKNQSSHKGTNMPHEITPANEHLEFLHSAIMKEVHKVIEQDSPFKFTASTLGLDCVSVAKKVFQNMSARNLDDIVKGRKWEFDTFGAFPIQDDKLKESVENIYAKLLEHIDDIPATLREKIVKSSAEMNGDKNNIFSINNQYLPFKPKQGELQPVSTGDKKSGDKLFRAHLCKVQLTAGQSVHDKLRQAVSTHYDNLVRADNEIEDEDQTEAIAEINRQINKLFDEPDNRAIIGLRELLDKETSGLIRRELGITYLEYLLEQAKQQSIQAQELEKIVNNIRLVENYIHHADRGNNDCLYQVTDEHSCDLRELLSNADAFEKLPVIGRIDGNLEERTGGEERVFVFGLRFKANNPVTTPDRDFPELKSGRSVYARHLEKAIKVLELAKQFNTAQGEGNPNYSKLRFLLGKSIRTVFLYYMVFSDHSEKIAWWQETATLLHERAPKALDRLLVLANKMLKAEKMVITKTITPALETLKGVLKDKTACIQDNIKRCILLEKDLINKDIEGAAEGEIFIKDLNKSEQQEKNTLKKVLRYVRIVKENEIALEKSLHSIPFYLSFYDNFFYADRTQRRAVSVLTQPQIWHFLPVLVRPQILRQEQRDNFHQLLTKSAGLMIQIMPEIKPDQSNTFEFFIYKLIVAVVFQLGLSALCQKLSAAPINLAIPLIRVHKADETDPIEEYLKSVCAAVTFLLNEKYMAGMQGIQLLNLDRRQQGSIRYKITNARSSLYAFLPKTFIAPDFAPAFKKLAVIVVTQRIASKHRQQDDNHSLINLFGRVIMLERVDERHIHLTRHYRTFADNLNKTELNSHPQILVDTVHHLYDECGVRDILYIAKAPFTSNLNLTQKNAQKDLFFMSETVIQQMGESRDDLNIYPIFCGKYPARMFSGAKLNAVYIDDVPSIQKYMQMDRDSESQIVTFLNIANGIKVTGKEADKNFFNNVMYYATLDNLYKDRTLQSRIMERLVATDAPERKTLIDFLCLLHAAAYEKVDGKKATDLTLKLNPYQDILEDDNVNYLNTYAVVPNEKLQFNLFAFMTKIQRVISLIGKKL